MIRLLSLTGSRCRRPFQSRGLPRFVWALFALGWMATVEGDPLPLFLHDADPSSAASSDPLVADVSSARRFNPEAIRWIESGEPLNAGAVLRLNLFPEADHGAVLSNVQSAAGELTTWTGRLENRRDSNVILTVGKDWISGVAHGTDAGSVSFHGRRNGECTVRALKKDYSGHGRSEAIRSLVLKHHRPVDLGTVNSAIALQRIAPDLEPSLESVRVLDLLMVYTPESRAAAGGKEAVEALIHVAVAEANTTFQNSRANIRVRLVHLEELDSEESPFMETNLDRLQIPDDGFFDEAHALRDEHDADLVSMLTFQGEEEIGGLAYVMSNPPSEDFSDFAFSVIRLGAAVGFYTLAHELAHNLGCQHNRENAVDTEGNLLDGAFHYSYGLVFQAQGREFRTVMGVGEGQRIPFFSNPTFSFLGVSIGVLDVLTNSAANNTLTLNNTGELVSSFRGEPVETLPPSIVMTAPASGTEVNVGDEVTLRASVLDPDGEIDYVEFYRDLDFLGSVTSDRMILGEASLIMRDAFPGDFELTALAFDDSGASAISLPVRLIVRPVNDDFANRVALSGDPLIEEGNNAAATAEFNEPQHTPNPGINAVWYQWKAPRDGSVVLKITGDGIVPLPAVYTGADFNGLSRVVQSLRFSGANNSTATVEFDVVANRDYQIAVAALSDVGGVFEVSLEIQSGPGNDHFVDAVEISGEEISFSGTNEAANREPGEPVHVNNTGGKSVWYGWTAPRNGAVIIEVRSVEMFPLVDAYTGDSVSALTVAASRSAQFLDDNPEQENLKITRIQFLAQAGQQIWIAVTGLGGLSGDFDFTLDMPDPPLNDDFANALQLAGGAVELEMSNQFATRETGEPRHASNNGGPSIWFRWTAPVSGPVDVLAKGDGFLALADVYVGDAVDSLQTVNRSIEFLDDNTGAAIEFDARAFDEYRLAVDGFSGKSGTFLLSLAARNTPPVIDLSTAAIVSEGDPAFGFTVQGSPGQGFAVQASSDLTDWIEIFSAQFESETFQFTDAEFSQRQRRYYRVLPIP